MKITDSQKVVLPTEGASGKATASAFAQIMNLLINVLAKLGLLKEDLDYHVVRASMVIIYFFFGYQKWFAYEAQELIPFISNGPLISWMYPVFGIRGASWFGNGVAMTVQFNTGHLEPDPGGVGTAPCRDQDVATHDRLLT